MTTKTTFTSTTHVELETNSSTRTKTEKELKKFLKDLGSIGLQIDPTTPSPLFDSAFDLVASFFAGKKGDSSRLKRDLTTFLLEFPDFKQLMPELSFLSSNECILFDFIRAPESTIYSELSLFLLALFYNVRISVYCKTDKSTMVNLSIGDSLKTETTLKVGIFLFENKATFLLLKRDSTEEKQNEAFELNKLIQRVVEGNSINNPELTFSETVLAKIIKSHLSLSHYFTPGVSVCGKRFKNQQNLYWICQVQDCVSGSMDFVSFKPNQDMNKAIETLSLRMLTNNQKAFVLFGVKTGECLTDQSGSSQQNQHRHQVQTEQSLLQTQRHQFVYPPGLKQKFHTCPTSQNLQVGSEINKTQHGDAKRTQKSTASSTQLAFQDDDQLVAKLSSERAPLLHLIVENNKDSRVTGRLKFVNEKGKFGFFVKDSDKSDVFFHFSELEKAGIRTTDLTKTPNSRVSFVEVNYVGKHSASRKAEDIKQLK